jgi:hypothetical protein
MKINNLLFIIFAFSNLELSAQLVTESDFKGTNWFSVNQNNHFYDADTISIIRIEKFNSYIDSINEQNIKLKYVGYKDLTYLNFIKSGRLYITNLHVNSWTDSWREGKWRWKFSDPDQKLTLYFNKKIDSKFKVLSQDNDTTTWKFEDNGNKTDYKLNLLIIRLIRIQNNSYHQTPKH